jgi:hypothetical protein
LFTFYVGGTRVSINCADGSSNFTSISAAILNNTYFQNITRVSVNNRTSISETPAFLCTLPSTQLDLSNQSFRVLDNRTFPCGLDSNIRTINLAFNQISSINLTLSNWILIDLTANNLSQLPYTLLRASQSTRSARQLVSSQRNLLLPSNNIGRFDLYVYTYPNTQVDLRSNPLSRASNGYQSIENVQSRSLPVTTVTAKVTFPNSMRFLINDQLAQDYDACGGLVLNSLVDVLQRMKSDNATVEVQCDCSAFYFKEYFRLFNTSGRITRQFSCNPSSSFTADPFENLSESQCLSSITTSSRRLCVFTRLQVMSRVRFWAENYPFCL